MKSAAYIARLFKGYKILTVSEDIIEKVFTWYRFKLIGRGGVTCTYDIYIYLDQNALTAKARREQAQAKELVQALQALPRYEERR